MAGTILKALKFPCSVLAGSAVSAFNDRSTMINGTRYFVAETCEYRRHFLHFSPEKIILTSIESDHQDYYPTYESIVSAFMQYINSLPQFGELIYCADDPGACEAARMVFASRPDIVYTPYGERASGDYRVTFKGIQKERQVFTLGGFSGQFRLGSRKTRTERRRLYCSCRSLLKEEGHELTVRHFRIRSSLESFRVPAEDARFSARHAESCSWTTMPIIYRHTKNLAGLREFYPTGGS